MLDFEKLKGLTPEEVKLAAVMDTILQQAEQVVDMIKHAYSFKMGEDRIVVADDGNNQEYLTFDGWWQARYLHQKYDVKIGVEEIFQMQLCSYAVEKGICPETFNGTMTDEGKMAEIDRYFGAFVKRTREKLEDEELKHQLQTEFK